MKLALLLLPLVVFAVEPQTHEQTQDQGHCRSVYDEHGMSRNLNETIAHSIHALTMDDVRKFNPDAKQENVRIPTVNHDLSSNEKVIDEVPEMKKGEDFSTGSMNTVDSVLSKIGNDDDGLGQNWSPTERLVHRFHMNDVMNKVKETHSNEVEKNPPSRELCDCLTDTHSNGIHDAVSWVANHYKSGTPITLLNKPIPKLTDSDSWQVWKDRLLHYYKPSSLRDSALYMHCASGLPSKEESGFNEEERPENDHN